MENSTQHDNSRWRNQSTLKRGQCQDTRKVAPVCLFLLFLFLAAGFFGELRAALWLPRSLSDQIVNGLGLPAYPLRTDKVK